MIDRVLHKRLERQLQDPVPIDVRIDINPVIKDILVSDLLYLQIAADVQFLVPDRNELSSVTERKLEKVRQRHDHVFCLFLLVPFNKPHDRIERVVQEMRIDLFLQKPKLSVAHLSLIILDLGNHDLQMAGHIIDRARHAPDLIPGIHAGPGAEIAVRNALRDPCQLTERPRDVLQYHISNNDDCGDQKDQKKAGQCAERQDAGAQICAQVLNALRLIVNVILDVIVDQFRKNVDIIIEHIYILIISAAFDQIAADIVHAVLQRIDVPQKVLQPDA